MKEQLLKTIEKLMNETLLDFRCSFTCDELMTRHFHKEYPEIVWHWTPTGQIVATDFIQKEI